MPIINSIIFSRGYQPISPVTMDAEIYKDIPYYESIDFLNIKANEQDIVQGFNGTDWFNNPILTPMEVTVPSGNITTFLKGTTFAYDSQVYKLYNIENDIKTKGILINSDDKSEETTYKAYMLIENENRFKLNLKENGDIKTTNEYIMSNFSSDNYATSNIDLTQPFKLYFDATVGDVGFNQKIIYTTNGGINIGVSNDNSLRIWLVGTSGSYIVDAYTIQSSITSGTRIRGMLSFTGSSYQYYDWDDESETLKTTLRNTSTKLQQGDLFLGCDVGQYGNEYWRGTLDLKGFKQIVNDEVMWKAVSDETVRVLKEVSVGLSETELTEETLPEKYDECKIIKDITVPEHNRWDRKDTVTDTSINENWVLKDRKGVTYLAYEPEDKPLQVDVSAFDKDFGEPDELTPQEVFKVNGISDSEEIQVNKDDRTVKSTSSSVVTISTLDDFDKNDGYYYYFSVTPQEYGSTYNEYYMIAECLGMFTLYLYRYSSYNYFVPGWRDMNSSSGGSRTYDYHYEMYSGTKYYFRVFMKGNTSRIDWSRDGKEWTTLATLNTQYINSKSINPMMLKLQPIIQNIYNLEDTYITDEYGNILWKSYIYGDLVVSSHDIIPITREILFVKRDNEEDKGNLVNYEDDGSAIDINLYSTIIAEYKSHDYTPPILTSNGTMGGTDFAVTQSSQYGSSYYAYRAFDGSVNTSWTNQDSMFPAYVTWYTPDYTHVRKISVKQHNTSLAATRGKVEESNDNVNWTTIGTFNFSTYTGDFDIICDDTNGCKYHRYVIESATSTRVDTNLITIDSYTIDDFETETLKYLISPDDSFVDGTLYKTAEFVENISIPEHTIYRWDREKQRYLGQKILTIEVDDEDARLYTEIEEVE